jgi:uncharacterized protein YecE (DUF72 family)
VRIASNIRIGISGWRYPGWRGTFYPKGLNQKSELYFASRQVNSIEINGSFYSLQTPKLYKRWHDSVPDDFVFSIKGSRFITHIRRLKDVEIPLANFFASGVLSLNEKLGPFLWQLPPSFKYDRERLEHFFKLLPRTTDEASYLARKHDGRLKSRAKIKNMCEQKLRHSLEVRNSTFETEEFIELLRAHNIAGVVADTAGKWPYFEDLTSDFCYLRLHGEAEIYASGYDDESLQTWAKKIECWSNGREVRSRKVISSSKPSRIRRDVYCYFDNDIKVRAPFDAIRLLEKLTSFQPQEISFR